MSLTSPLIDLIDQAIAQVCAFCSPAQGPRHRSEHFSAQQRLEAVGLFSARLDIFSRPCHMARAKEFTVTIADKPGALGKCFLSLAERGVNILAFQSFVEERESLMRFVADDSATAQAVLRETSMIFEETDVAVVKLAHRPGAAGRAAARLGEAQINIDYSYCGFEPGSSLALLVFGVDSLTKASSLLDTLSAEDHEANASS